MLHQELGVVDRLVANFDHHDPELTPDIAIAVHDEIRERSRVAYSSAHGGMWMLSRYADVEAALRDQDTFSAAKGVFFPRAPGTPLFAPLDYDQPRHTAFRKLMRQPLAPAAVDERRSAVAEIVRDMIAPIAQRGSGDLVRELAVPLPLTVLGMAVGFSAEARARLRELTENMWARMATDEDSSGFWPQFRALYTEEIDRAHRAPGDDYVSTLVQAHFNGQPLSEEELHVVLPGFAIAGHEPVLNALSHLLWQLGTNPALQEDSRLRPELRGAIVEETLRLWSPDHGTRVTTRDVEIDGTVIPANSRVVLMAGAANRDPRVFDDPHTFRLDRGPIRHLSFGHGVHFCLGAPLARIELAAVLDELAEHPKFVVTNEPYRHYVNGRHINFDRLDVTFTE